MKALLVTLVLLIGVVSSKAYAGSSNGKEPQTPQEKKTIKPKYDFNLFKFFSVPATKQQATDSLKIETKTKSIILTRKETPLMVKTKKQS